MSNELRVELFKDPPVEFRGVPFWSINDRLRVDELVRQVKLLKDAGFGGAFFHAREGLLTPFLGGEWFKAIRTVVDEAAKVGFRIWLYDEDRWPSGFAGGKVTSRGPEYRAKALVLLIHNAALQGPEVIASFKCSVDGGSLKDCAKVSGEEAIEGYVYLNFIKYTAPAGNHRFNGFNYVDVLNPSAIDGFIKEAYEPYIKVLGEFIGSAVPGIFTDEPNLNESRPPRRQIPLRHALYSVYSLPWTDNFPEYFMRINGYDIVERLPELFFDIGSYTKTRYDYWRAVTELFVNSYSRRIYEWCGKNGLLFTGHYLAEDTLISQLAVGAVMPHYEYMHIPGMDHLCLRTWEMLLTAKQVSSVANQLGKERVLSETYGATGNGASFEDRKWIGDFLYALGVNLLNHHLVPYSMRGRRKRDYGLNIHWSQPWWPYNRVIEDYFARLSYVLSRGIRLAEVLVVHPMGSVWATYSPVNQSRAEQYDASLTRLMRQLIASGIDFELGDESIMAKYGGVEGNLLRVGRAVYRIVVIPPSLTLTRETVRLLRAYVDNGGILVAIEPTPTMMDGVESGEVKELVGRARVFGRVEDAVSHIAGLGLSIKVTGGGGDVVYQARRVGDSLVFFLANTSRSQARDVEVHVKGAYAVEEWDAFTGSISDYPATIVGDETVMKARLKPVGSRLLVLRPGTPRPPMEAPPVVKVSEVDLAGGWVVRRLNPNVAVLDYAQVVGITETPVPIPRVRDLLVNRGVGSEYRLIYRFNASRGFGGVSLVVEDLQGIRRVSVNGTDLDLSRPSGTWLDWNFKTYDVTGMVKEGANEVIVDGVVALEPEFEPIYLLGDFGVRVIGPGLIEIGGESAVSAVGDLTKMGYPFYSGIVEYERVVKVGNFDSAVLRLRYGGALAVVSVNGSGALYVINNSDEVDLTGLLKPGENKLKVTVVGTLKNTLGPLHRRDGDPICVGPESFLVGDAWTDDYVLRPFGLLEARLELYGRQAKWSPLVN